VVCVDFYLAWKIENEVLCAILFVNVKDLLFEPVLVLLKELETVYHAAIRAKLEFLHDLIKPY
jgi:hypothetical protein